jgi:hypothetical protein
MVTCTASVPDKDTSGDNFYGQVSCNQQFIDWALNAYSIDQADWDEGFGYEEPCNTDRPLSRTLNAIWVLAYSAVDYDRDAYTKSDVVPPGSVVTAVARGPDHLDLFVVGYDGGIYHSAWSSNNNERKWMPWRAIGNPDAGENVPIFSTVTAISRNPSRIDIFVVGHNGGIYTSGQNNGGGWENWHPVGDPGAGQTVPIRSTVWPVARNSNQIDIFVIGHNGGIYTSGQNNGGGWENWHSVGNPSAGHNVPINSTVSAVARNSDRIDIFVVGHNGGIYTSGQNNGGGWENWHPVGDPGAGQTVPIRSTVWPVARNSNQIDIFVIGHNGGIYTSGQNNGGGWENWHSVGNPSAGHNVPINSTVSAVARNSDRIDIFVVGHNGGIYTSGQNNGGGWENWHPVGDPGAGQTVPIRSTVWPVARNSNQIDIFVVGNDGGIYSAWWNPNSNWANWFPISCFNILHWARRYTWDQIDELDAVCGDGTYDALTHQGIDDYTLLSLSFFYQRNAVERAGTLLHEARHMGGKHHDSQFPTRSPQLFNNGPDPKKFAADSTWGFEGAWMFDALYLWWFYFDGRRTTPALRASAKARANIIINNCFATHPGFLVL